jgi:hypothetical protein
MTKSNFVNINVGQLKQLIEDVDDDKEIRVWCEMKNKDNTTYLSGRRLTGITDEDDYCCLCALLYQTEDENDLS